MMNLTKPQKLIYDMEKFAGGSVSIICGSMLIYGKKELSEIKQAVNELFRMNGALRIRINENNGEVSQCFSEYAEQDFDVISFENKEKLNDYAQKYAKEPLDFYGNLCEVKVVMLPEQYGLLIKLHHIISDAWTLALLGTQFNKLMNGEKVETYSYVDYIENENVYIKSKRYEKDKLFFIEQFKKCDEVTYLSEKQKNSLCACRKTFIMNAEQRSVIDAYVKKKGTSAFMLFTTVLAAYMNRIKRNAERFYIGTAVLNRKGTKENNTVGMFVNTVPMLIELDGAQSFSENLSSIEGTAFSILRHQKYNYGDVLSAIRKEFNFNEKLYDVLISYQNAAVLGGNIETIWYHPGSQNETLQIHIDDRDNEGVFRIHYDYLMDKYTEDEIEKMYQHMCNLLFDAIEDDSRKLYELELLSDNERKKILFDFNDTVVEYPKNKDVHQLFEEQVVRMPNETAVIACDRTLTYAELNEQANKIAHALIEKGVCIGDKVIYTLTRKSYLFAAIFGILKAGAAYIPVAPDYPEDRVAFMYKDSNAKFCINEENISELLQNPNSQNPNLDISSENLCYCIYTSGSTGNPKGVMIRHRNIANFVHENRYNVVTSNFTHQQKTIAAIDTCGFDIFKTESLLPLCDGFTIVFADEMQSKNPKEFARLMRDYPADILQTTPTKLKMLISDDKYIGYLKNVKSIIVGGEALELSFLRELRQKSDARIFNNYGPTETTVWSTLTEITSEDIHIGKPIANTQIYIVDKYMNLTPIGVTGELCIAGDGVGIGYLNRPELTAEKFIDNPFGEGKLYKTGDLAFWREDGNISYVGRNDFQVKIRGLRIELGEIENAICCIDGISQAIATVRQNSEGRQLICAFYTGEEVEAKEIRSHMGKRLPRYMLPHIFIHLEEMPLTSSGKINRKALPEIDFESSANNTEYVAPNTPMQKELCKLMETVLDIHPIGITEDFFDLGGDSLKAIEFVSKAHSQGIYMNLQSVFDYPNVNELSKYMESSDKQFISFDDVDFTEINKILNKNTLESDIKPQMNDVGNILLAGATGYLGIHILADYLEHEDGTAYCLVRGKDQMDAMERLQRLLEFYFEDKYLDLCRIKVICADLQKDKFGLSDKKYEELLPSINTVINCAASVKHYGSYQYFYEANVDTTKQLVEFCKVSNAKFIHTSTISVSGNSFADEFSSVINEKELRFYECDLYIGQPLDNVYARSKFEAEKVVLDAMNDGLQANIMRMGNLTNRLKDGQFQKNYETNAFLRRIQAILELGVVPEYLTSLYVEFTPIDEAANAVMTIARHFNTEYTVFHINSSKVVYMDKLFEILNQLGFKLEIVNGIEFAENLRQTVNQTGAEHIFETFINDIDENERLVYDSKISVDNKFTVEYLKRIGFEWSDIDMDYLRKYVEYFRRIGYLK